MEDQWPLKIQLVIIPRGSEVCEHFIFLLVQISEARKWHMTSIKQGKYPPNELWSIQNSSSWWCLGTLQVYFWHHLGDLGLGSSQTGFEFNLELIVTRHSHENDHELKRSASSWVSHGEPALLLYSQRCHKWGFGSSCHRSIKHNRWIWQRDGELLILHVAVFFP